MSTFELYLLMILPQIGVGLGFTSFLLGVATVFAAAPMLDDDDGVPFSYWRKTLGWGVACGVVALFIPNQEKVLILLGWTLAQDVEGLSSLPAETVTYLHEYMKHQIEVFSK